MNRIVIGGASAGGLATAEALRRAGYGGVITLVGEEPHLPYDRPPLSKQVLTGEREPDRLVLRDKAEMDALGLDLRLGAPAIGLDPSGRSVALADGAEIVSTGGAVTGVRLADETALSADDVLVAIGSVPNTAWLDGSGLALGDGLVCDGVLAAGLSPRILRTWRALIAARTPWATAIADTAAA
ncbi:FAD-dependent oxidoreductase [Nonomuraea sp. CA-143628]|uniref:FAD-dependent oxidoreductase n=1 Tax=Nonomuraea sp. CA-143628 TaxID=3239997 RepID=UPI003D9161FC